MSRNEAAIGLTEAEAQARLRAEGFNDLPKTDHRTFLRIIGDVLREPMFALLLGAGVDLSRAGRSHRSPDAAGLRHHLGLDHRGPGDAQRARPRGAARPDQPARPGHPRRRAQAHPRPRGRARRCRGASWKATGFRPTPLLVAASDLLVDESLLTGEVGPGAQSRRGDRRCRNGPAGRRGSALRVLRHAGRRRRGRRRSCARPARRSEIGRIGQALRTDRDRAAAPAAARRAGWSAASRRSAWPRACWPSLLYGLLRGDWLKAVLGGIALGMAMLPEEFPLVLTVFLALGAWRHLAGARADAPRRRHRDARRRPPCCAPTRPARSPRTA